MKIKHWQGYGTVTAVKIKDTACTLHIRVTGNHEWGLIRRDVYDLFNWLVKRFDKTETKFLSWNNRLDGVRFEESKTIISGQPVDTCDYYFNYVKENNNETF